MATPIANSQGQLAEAVSEYVGTAKGRTRREDVRSQLLLDLERFVHRHPRAPFYLHDVGASRSRWWNDMRGSRCQPSQSQTDRVMSVLRLNAFLAVRTTASDSLLATVAFILEGEFSKARTLVEGDLPRFEASLGADVLRLAVGLLAELTNDLELAERSYKMVCESELHQYRICALFSRAFIRVEPKQDELEDVLRLIASEQPELVETLGQAIVATRARRDGVASIQERSGWIAQEAKRLEIPSPSFLSSVF